MEYPRKVTLLSHTIKPVTEYSYAYILITNTYTVDEIVKAQKGGKKIVFWGCSPEAYFYWQILAQNGIFADYGCDVYCEYEDDNHGLKMRPYWELLAEKNKYYFIITMPFRQNIVPIMKQLFYARIDEFGIVYSEWSKDFASKWKNELSSAVYSSINEVFNPEPLFGSYERVENLRRSALEGLGYWDVLYTAIYKLGRNASQLKYLEIGAGTGIMSFALKKLLGERIQIDWLSLPLEEPETEWQERKNSYWKTLVNAYNVKEFFGSIETDNKLPNPLMKRKYDIIVLSQVMEHFILNPIDVFIKCRHLLSEHGKIFVSVPNNIHHHNVRSWKEIPHLSGLDELTIKRRIAINNYFHFHEYTQQEAEEVFDAAGLEVVWHRFNHPINFFILRKKIYLA